MAWGTNQWDGSQGSSTVLVPDCVGLTEAAADALIESVGLVVGTDTSESSEYIASGYVASQSPVKNTSASVGDTVTLSLSTGPLGATWQEYQVYGPVSSYTALMTYNSGQQIQAIPLSNGNIAVVNYFYDSAYKIICTVFDSSMTVIHEIKTSAGDVPGYSPEACQLTNGNVAVGYTDDSDYYSQYCIFDPVNGTLIKDITEISQNERYDDGYFVCALTGGGFVHFSTNGDVRATVIDNAGDIVTAETVIHTGGHYPKAVGLSNGNFLVCYSNKAYAVLDPDLNFIIEEIPFTDITIVQTNSNRPYRNVLDDTIQLVFPAEAGTDVEATYMSTFSKEGQLLVKDKLVNYQPRYRPAHAGQLSDGTYIVGQVGELLSLHMRNYIQFDKLGATRLDLTPLGFGTTNTNGYRPMVEFGDGKVICFHEATVGYQMLAPKLAGDTFTGDDDSAPDTDIWTEVDTPSNMSIQSNKLNYTGTETSLQTCHVTTNGFAFVGDAEVQVDFDYTALGQPASGNQELMLEILDATETNYVSVAIYKDSAGDISYHAADSDATSDAVVTTDTSGKLKITRVGSVIKVFEWSGAQWEWDGNAAGLTMNCVDEDDFYIRLKFTQQANAALNANFDNLVIT